MNRPVFRQMWRKALLATTALMFLAILFGGCLDRPVAPATPSVSARVITPAKQDKITKIDLLFMLDNSSSMADKNAILAQAVPDLVSRLVNPVCIDPVTGLQVGIRSPDGSCATGEPDFDPVKDIHIGIITSSLGGHGTTGVCDDPDPRMQRTFEHNNDKGHLVARGPMDAPVQTFQNQGFLNWNPNLAGAAMTPDQIIMPFTTMVQGVGQHGCGYEAQMEAFYRFLIDPNPYDTLTVDMSGGYPGVAVVAGTDQMILTQRANFLRPDSLVAIIMLTDENDASIIDGGQNFYVIIPASGNPATSVLGRGTSTCLTNPNDRCCFNCGQAAPSGCPDPKSDSECMKGAYTRADDPENLREFHQKQRYGIDFYYPVKRYIDGLTQSQIADRDGNVVQNPLFDDLTPTCDHKTKVGCAGERDKTLVFLTGIIGVPWQDIAVNPMNLAQGYLTAQQIADQNIWSKILGQPDNPAGPVLPTDAHMIESVGPRQGLAPPASARNADPINGHEWDPSQAPTPNSDLQYACIFDLNPNKTCTSESDCDCFGNVAGMMNPLCQGTGGAYSTTQVRAKAYPGLRELQVLQGIGNQAIVASICPSNTSDMNAADFGYRPAIAALISRLRTALRGRCLPRQLAVTPDGQVPCVIVEAFNPPVGAPCNCMDKPGRLPADPQTITDEVRSQGTCFCEIVQLNGDSKTACQTQVSPPGTVMSGWCYVDPSQTHDMAQCPLVKSCPSTDRRIIRFVNPDSEPRGGATAFIMCQEQSFPNSGGAPVDPCL